jgi:hypothetical protein
MFVREVPRNCWNILKFHRTGGAKDRFFFRAGFPVRQAGCHFRARCGRIENSLHVSASSRGVTISEICTVREIMFR